jgi:hypothetical protein
MIKKIVGEDANALFAVNPGATGSGVPWEQILPPGEENGCAPPSG